MTSGSQVILCEGVIRYKDLGFLENSRQAGKFPAWRGIDDSTPCSVSTRHLRLSIVQVLFHLHQAPKTVHCPGLMTCYPLLLHRSP